MPEDRSEEPREDPDRREALIADVLNERTFIRLTRPEELTQFRTQLWAVIEDVVPQQHHQRVQGLFTNGLDRVLDALVGDARALEALTMWARSNELKALQLEGEVLQLKIRVRRAEVDAAGGNSGTDPELAELMTQLIDLTRRVRRVQRDM